ncbi:hypothetical protein LLG88_13550 [bacterium]|nr:hypothetical protein [bacterium]
MPDNNRLPHAPYMGPLVAIESFMRAFDPPPEPPEMLRARKVVAHHYPGLDRLTAKRLILAVLKLQNDPDRPQPEREIVDAYYGHVLDAEFEDVVPARVREIEIQEK